MPISRGLAASDGTAVKRKGSARAGMGEPKFSEAIVGACFLSKRGESCGRAVDAPMGTGQGMEGKG